MNAARSAVGSKPFGPPLFGPLHADGGHRLVWKGWSYGRPKKFGGIQ